MKCQSSGVLESSPANLWLVLVAVTLADSWRIDAMFYRGLKKITASQVAKESTKNLLAKQEVWIQSLVQGRSAGGGHGNPLQDSFLENPMDRGAWQAAGPRGCQESGTT